MGKSLQNSAVFMDTQHTVVSIRKKSIVFFPDINPLKCAYSQSALPIINTQYIHHGAPMRLICTFTSTALHQLSVSTLVKENFSGCCECRLNLL
jgi:hypothetical protein